MDSLKGLRVAVFVLGEDGKTTDFAEPIHVTDEYVDIGGRVIVEAVKMGENYPGKTAFVFLPDEGAWRRLFPDPFKPERCFGLREPTYELIPVS